MPLSNISNSDTFYVATVVRMNQLIDIVNKLVDYNLTTYGTITLTNPSGFKSNVTLNVASGYIKGDGALISNVAGSNVVSIPNSSLQNSNISFVSSNTSLGIANSTGVLGGNVVRLYIMTSNSVSDSSATNIASAASVQTTYNYATGLVAPVSTKTDASFNQANAAFVGANTASATGTAAFVQANTASATGTAAYTQANTASATGAAAFGHANSSFSHANGAYELANTSAANVQTFTSSGTWYKPTKGNTVIIQAWGGGGGGGKGLLTSVSSYGGGGGEGVYAVLSINELGSTETITIGAGGSGATSNNGSGTAGGNTTVGTLVTALGGTGGTATTPGVGGSVVRNPINYFYTGSDWFAFVNGVFDTYFTSSIYRSNNGIGIFGSGGAGYSANSYGGGGAGGGMSGLYSNVGGTAFYSTGHMKGGNGGQGIASGDGQVPGGGGGGMRAHSGRAGNGGAGKVIITVV